MSLSVLWSFFHRREKQNSSYFKAHCKGCVEYHLLQGALQASPGDSEDLDPTKKLHVEKLVFDQDLFYLFAYIIFGVYLFVRLPQKNHKKSYIYSIKA